MRSFRQAEIKGISSHIMVFLHGYCCRAPQLMPVNHTFITHVDHILHPLKKTTSFHFSKSSVWWAKGQVVNGNQVHENEHYVSEISSTWKSLLPGKFLNDFCRHSIPHLQKCQGEKYSFVNRASFSFTKILIFLMTVFTIEHYLLCN